MAADSSTFSQWACRHIGHADAASDLEAAVTGVQSRDQAICILLGSQRLGNSLCHPGSHCLNFLQFREGAGNQNTKMFILKDCADQPSRQCVGSKSHCLQDCTIDGAISQQGVSFVGLRCDVRHVHCSLSHLN